MLREQTHKIWNILLKELKNKIPKKTNTGIYVYHNRYNFQTNLKNLLKINDDVKNKIYNASTEY